jgi:hypothetical protein
MTFLHHTTYLVRSRRTGDVDGIDVFIGDQFVGIIIPNNIDVVVGATK